MKICIIYNTAQHYREGIWHELSLDKNNDFHIYCDYIDNHKINQIPKESINYYHSKGKLKIFPILKNFYYKHVLLFQFKLIPLIFFKKYDMYIFLGDSYSISTWISLIYLKLRNKYVCIWTHGAKGDERFFKKNFLKIFYNLSNHILLYGNYAKNIITKDFKIQKKISVIFNSLNYQKQVIIRNSLKNKLPLVKEKYIVFIGRVEKRKRVDLLIKSFQKIIENQKFKGMKLVIIGDGNMLNDLKAESNSSNIIFLGPIYDELIISNYLYNAELLVSPGHVGLNVIHCLTYGTPIITHNNFKNHAPEFEAIKVGETGDFFTENSIEDLIETIKKWLINLETRNLTRKKCYNVVEKYYNPKYQHEIIKTIIKGLN